MGGMESRSEQGGDHPTTRQQADDIEHPHHRRSVAGSGMQNAVSNDETLGSKLSNARRGQRNVFFFGWRLKLLEHFVHEPGRQQNIPVGDWQRTVLAHGAIKGANE